MLKDRTILPEAEGKQDASGPAPPRLARQMEAENLHRYVLAQERCRGLDVLDIASGEHEGTALLAQAANYLVQVQVGNSRNGGTRRHEASGKWAHLAADAAQLPLGDASFDVVVALNITELAAEQATFLKEIRRVLRPGGLLVTSFLSGDKHGLDDPAPVELLFHHFPHVASALQLPGSSSFVIPIAAKLAPRDADPTVTIFERRGDSMICESANLSHAHSLICFASDQPVAQAHSLFIDCLEWDACLEKASIAQEAAGEAGLAALLADALAAKATLEAAVLSSNITAARALQEAASSEFRLHRIEQSTIWKMSWPIRRVLSRVPLLGVVGRRAMQITWWGLTLQLPARMRARRRAQAAKGAWPPPLQPTLVEAPSNPAGIVIVSSATPTVSVIIPTFSQVDYTLDCLASIAACPSVTPFEVIVAEDASGDPRVAELRSIRGIRLIENACNLGFLRNANAAAGIASGEFLLFLNNDTQVQEGWLDRLVELLKSRPDAGAAGSKLIYPDGRLQEAGGIIWDDASGWNYGRLGNPDAPSYNYVREVDYASGASLMVRRDAFHSLGGFDEHFAPAYYEDTDLAFRIRAIGLKVLYQPRSVVVHFEGISHGTDETIGIKAIQAQNRVKFADRWSNILLQEHFPSGEQVVRACEHARQRIAILIVDHYVPEPDRDAGSRLMFGFLCALIDAGWLIKFWPDNGAYRPGYTEALQDLGVDVLYGPGCESFEDWIATNGAAIDIALLSRPDVADGYIASLRQHSPARLAYFGHDLHFSRLRMQAEATGAATLLPVVAAMEALERSIWRRVDVVLYPSADETAAVARLEPGVDARAVVPYAFASFGSARSAVRGTDILFVAGFAHPPNEDAAVWFAERILPVVLKRVPEARLLVVGSNPTDRVRHLASEHISLHVNVSDVALRAFYQAARVAVVPLRFGAGVKLKVAEALQEGLPLVTTPVGAQGCPGLEHVVALHDDPEGFAEAVCTLLLGDDAWAAASARQIAYAKFHFSRQAVQSSLLSALQ